MTTSSTQQNPVKYSQATQHVWVIENLLGIMTCLRSQYALLQAAL